MMHTGLYTAHFKHYGMPAEGWRCAWCADERRHVHEVVCYGPAGGSMAAASGGGGGTYVSPLDITPGETVTIKVGSG